MPLRDDMLEGKEVDGETFISSGAGYHLGSIPANQS
jgi:hypothetical protein